MSPIPRNRAICIIDDDAAVLSLLGNYLTVDGCECLPFQSVEEFLAYLSRHSDSAGSIALVVTDWEFSGQRLQGRDLIEALRPRLESGFQQARLPILIHSGRVPVQLSELGFDAQGVGQVVKGGSPRELILKVRQMMSQVCPSS